MWLKALEKLVKIHQSFFKLRLSKNCCTSDLRTFLICQRVVVQLFLLFFLGNYRLSIKLVLICFLQIKSSHVGLLICPVCGKHVFSKTFNLVLTLKYSLACCFFMHLSKTSIFCFWFGMRVEWFTDPK